MKKNLKYFLKNKLTSKEFGLLPASFDIIGSIMIFAEFPSELIKKEKIIGETILENYRNVKTILKKIKKYSGRYRTPKYKIIAGENTKEITYKENNVTLRLDVEKVYFSPRLATERIRIANLVKEGESVLVMFSGSGIYPLVIAKNSAPKIVYGIEINPTAHKYAVENIKLNRLENKIKLFKGDVKKIMGKNFPERKIFLNKFDRILMPLPKGAERFLGLALEHIRKNGTIHFYYFVHENKTDEAKKIVKEECEKLKKKFRILKIVKCGQFAPGKFRVCVDIKVL